MYKIVLWNHTEPEIHLYVYGFKSMQEAYSAYYDLKERFELMLIGDDFADGDVYIQEPGEMEGYI